MTNAVHGLSAKVVVESCALCDRAHEYWINHLELFDNYPREKEILESVAGKEWARLSIISQEYSLLQLIKLHDKAMMNGNITLGIDFVLTYGGWSDSVRSRFEVLAKALCGFADQLRGARNKILSHNDLATILANAQLGAFANGADQEYFNALQEFVNIVHEEVVGGPYPFNNLVRNDVAFFVRTIKPG